MVLCVRGSMNLGLALACGPYSLTLIPEDWARQCNMGAARGLSMSDGVRRVWNDVFVSPPVLELFPRCVPKLYPVFLIAVTWLLPWRSAGVSWSWVDLQHLYWRG